MVFSKTAALVALALALPTAASAETVNVGLRSQHMQDAENETLNQVRSWIVGIISKAAPPGRKIYYPEGQETVEEATARYESIADDLIHVIYDPKTKPLFRGENGRARTVTVVLGIMFHESAFMRQVDYGLGKAGRGDHGRSWCSLQIKVGDGKTLKWNTVHDRPIKWNDPKEEIFDGYTGKELVENRRLCISEGLKIMQLSFGGTAGLPLADRLRVYASGNREDGADKSHSRMNTAMRFYASSTKDRTFTDADVMKALANSVFPPTTAL
jgi:hypothetical protein